MYKKYSPRAIKKRHEEMGFQVFDPQSGYYAQKQYINLDRLLCDYKHNLIKQLVVVQEPIKSRSPHMQQVPNALLSSLLVE